MAQSSWIRFDLILTHTITACGDVQVEEAVKVGVESGIDAILQRVVYHPKLFKLKIHEDTYNDEVKIKHTLAGCEDVDFVSESQVRRPVSLICLTH